MNYREQFEQRENEKANKEDKKHPLLEKIIKDAAKGQRKYSDYSSGGQLSVNVEDVDRNGDTVAFILEQHYSVPNYGIEYSIDFGVIVGNKVYRNGFNMVRGGRPNDVDDFHGWYNTVRILAQEKDKVIIGLKSGGAIDIYEVNTKQDRIERIERYDLELEAKLKQQKELQQKAETSEDFNERLEAFGKKLKLGYAKPRDPFYKVIEHKGRKFGIIAIETYDRDYDASTETVDFYVLEQGSKEPELVLSMRPKYDKAYTYSKRFFSVRAHKEISDKVSEKDGVLTIPVKLTIRCSYGTTTWNSGSKELGEETLALKYKMKNE